MPMHNLATLLVLGAAASANPLKADLRALGVDDRPMDPASEARSTFGPVRPSGPIGAGGLSVGRAGGAAPRGQTLTVYESCDNLQPFPTVLNVQPGAAAWSDADITGPGLWRGTTVAGRTTYATFDDVGGNSSGKVRLMASGNYAPDQFFFGLRYEFLRSTDPLARAGFEPTVDQPAQLEHDLYVTSLDTMWTSEFGSVSSGALTGRVVWGGTCVDDCADLGFPTGQLPYVYSFNYTFIAVAFWPLEWRTSAPIGAPAGPVVMPTNRWIRVRHESRADGTIRHAFDFNDGTGFHVAYDQPQRGSIRFDALLANGSYEAPNSPMYLDNVTARGAEATPAAHPQPLECGPVAYHDDVEWLDVGYLGNQSPLWFDIGYLTTVDETFGDQVIRQMNYQADDRYRNQFSRALPATVAMPLHPWTLCEEVRIYGGFLHETVRGFAPYSQLDEAIVTRMVLGHYDPLRTPAYQGRVFVQHNPAYDPIDGPTSNPYLPGPNGKGGVPRIGGASTIGDPNFDYYDTGLSLAPFSQAKEWCVVVEHDRTMTVSYSGLDLVGGASGVSIDAFAPSITELRHESENQESGLSDALLVDDLYFQCNDVSCSQCQLPPLSLVYLDTLEWAMPVVPIGAQGDGRWSSAPSMPVEDLYFASQALRMENLHRDTVQSIGDFELFTQASTQMPNVVAAPDRGYAARADFRLTDGATTRAWMVAEADVIPGLFRSNAWLLYSADTGTLWYLRPDAVDPINEDAVWIDTGRTLASLGVGFDQWFSVTIALQLDGRFTFRINGVLLADSQGQIVHVEPLQSLQGGMHADLDRFYFLSGDDASAPAGSILHADNIRAWSLPCPGDVNEDGFVTYADINLILDAFNTPVHPGSFPNVAPDADNDGVADDSVVNFADLNEALSRFNSSCP